MRPRAPKRNSGHAKGNPGGPEGALAPPSHAPDDPKRGPRASQEAANGPLRGPKWTKMESKEGPKGRAEHKCRKIKNNKNTLVFIGFLKFWGSKLGFCWGQTGSVEV